VRDRPAAWLGTESLRYDIDTPPDRYHRRASRRSVILVRDREEAPMLWTIAVVLAVLWLLGMLSSYTLGGFIHILLLLAIVAILIRVIQGRRPV
jgi:fatty acid desaturase